MQHKKKRNSKEKSRLHPRNKHQGRYDLKELCNTCPDLKPFVFSLNEDHETIDFANPDAVKMLNKALLEHYYGVKKWGIQEKYLCPPIPGRADYIHHIADLLASSNQGIIPKGKHIKVLDIGVGANSVYPLIGNHEYEWLFTGVDVDAVAIQNAEEIVDANPHLKGKIKFRLQANVKDIFKGAMEKTERFDLTVCNPPFYASLEEAKNATLKKL